MNYFRGLRVEKSAHKVDKIPVVKKRRFTWKKFFISVVFLFVAVLGWATYIGLKSFSNISEGDNNIWDLFQKADSSDLRNDSGRTNILILGNGGANHPGGNLTDSMMILSLNTNDKKIAIISIPRDLYVDIYGNGKAKINTAYSYGESNKKGSGIEVVKKTVSETFDLPIHYYAKGDFEALVKIIDTVGGVTVDVAKAINDPYYPDNQMRGYKTFKISAGTQTLNGETALKYARSRETTSDFDRSRRQQQILIALKDKLLSAGTLSNPKKISNIFTILGEHFKTDLGTSEIKYISSISDELTKKEIATKIFDTSPSGGLNSSNYSGYTLSPVTGDFIAINTVIKNIYLIPEILAEEPTVILKRPTPNSSSLQLQNILLMMGYTVVKTDSSPKTTQSKITINPQRSKNNSLTFLQSELGVKNITQSDQKIVTDFIVEIGSDYAFKTKSY